MKIYTHTLKELKEIINRILLKIHVLPFITALRVLKNLEINYGHFKSVYRWESVDKQGEPVPWFSYPAIEYLKDIKLSGLSVFEYGSGNSTLFFSKHGANITSVESNVKWFNSISKKAKNYKNINLKLQNNPDKLVKTINENKRKYDIIVIDGESRTRLKCSYIAVNKLKTKGIIILDNADWFPNIAHYLRRKNLVQVNFTGLGPINPYTTTTAFFLTKGFNPVLFHKRKHPGSI